MIEKVKEKVLSLVDEFNGTTNLQRSAGLLLAPTYGFVEPDVYLAREVNQPFTEVLPSCYWVQLWFCLCAKGRHL